MKNNLIEIDAEFTTHYQELIDIQSKIWNNLKTYNFDLQTDEITRAIIQRMDAFWRFNIFNTKFILQRNINTTAADFFTEICMFFIKAYFENKYGLEVKSEKSITSGKKAIRPDITIWNQTELVAVIELKVNNGWKGKMITSHLIHREEQIHSLFPNAYFGAIAFWNFFDTQEPTWNEKYIGIKEYNKEQEHPRTNSRVESLFLSIEKHLNL